MLTKLFQDSVWLRNIFSSIKRLTVDASGQLRISGPVTATLAANQDIRNVTTLATVTTGNIGIGDSGKPATMISFSDGNFQGGGRRLISKV